MPLTSAANVAWQLAAGEARQSGAPLIEPDHLWLGICGIDKKLDGAASREIDIEWRALSGAFSAAGVDPVGLRRAIRSRLPVRPPSVATTVKRSAASHAVFERAEALARAAGGRAVSAAAFVAALLERDAGAELSGTQLTTLRTALQPLLAAAVSDVANAAMASGDESPAGDIRESLDATVSPFSDTSHDENTRRLALLFDVGLQLADVAPIDDLLAKTLAAIVGAIRGAQRGAILMRDASCSGGWLLKAHLPANQRPAVSTTLAQRAVENAEALIWRAAHDDAIGSMQASRSASAMYAPLLWRGEALGVCCVDSGDRADAFADQDLRLLIAVAGQVSAVIAARRLEQELRRNAAVLEHLLTNFSPKVRTQLLNRARHGRLRLGGERSEVTILCSDIRGFTQLSAGMDTDDVVEMLNDYFSVLVDSIFRFEGSIDKYIGDAILAVFGSPEADPQQHENAVRAAVAMQQRMRELTEARRARGRATCDIGIGVHCGEVLHGFIGANERMEFTVIGDAVNRAARYCDGARSGEVIISPELFQRVWRTVEAESASIPTKHEGDLAVHRLVRLRE